jgi:signal peptidase I
MNFDFPTILVLATFITGGIWLVDAMFFAPSRRRRFIASGALTGMDGKRPQPQEPVLVEYSRSFFPVILIVLLLRSFLAEPFRIPSGSMMPTLLVGDFILVNKYVYGLRLPVLNKKVLEMGEPQRGDVVVFRYPRNPRVDYIKRVVGLPGDHISYRNKTLYVNGAPQPQSPVGEYAASGAGSRMTGAQERVEMLGDRRHAILVNPELPDFGPGCQVLMFGEIQVPEGHYFAMGDNRDNSNDSRCWGLVPEENLVGRAFGIWMSFDAERSDAWFAWDRIGRGIE